MKRCTLCGQIYSDELVYCLQDGTVLVDDQSDAEVATVLRPHRAEGAKSPYLKYAAIAILGLIALVFAGALGAFVVWNRMATPADETAENNQAKASPTPSVTSPPRIPTPSPAANTANVRSDPTPTKTPARDDADEDDAEFSDPGTARINFRRGRVSETVSGRISRSRSFVLRTLGGQFLAASIDSAGDCVVFADGSRSTAFATSRGDTRLDIRNNCDRPVRFSLTVTVR